jgi:heme O synthase-like polyprenyltransferase
MLPPRASFGVARGNGLRTAGTGEASAARARARKLFFASMPYLVLILVAIVVFRY